MDEFVWLAVVVIAFPVMTLVAFVLALQHRTRLRLLETRLAALEIALARASARPAAMPAPPLAATPDAPGPSGLEPAPPSPDLAGSERAPEIAAPPVSEPAPVPPSPPKTSAPAEPAFSSSTPPPIAPAPARRLDLARLKENFGGFEEKIGARWSVWVGALALALGGVFLVRFAVEQNLIGPKARIGLGLLLAAGLLAGGEALRRLDRRQGFAGLPAASVPSLLTAVGTMTAFGSLYAAYEIYGLLSPQLAFALLGLTGVATVFAALLHGPALAALGFAGAGLTPLLVSSDTPNAWGVAILVMTVGAAALVVARLRLWRWLAVLALAGMAAWGGVLLAFAVPQAVPAAGMMGLGVLILTAVLLTSGHLYGPPEGSGLDLIATLGAALALALATAAAVEGEGLAPLVLLVLTALGALLIAWRAEAASFAAAAVALAVPVKLAAWTFPPVAGSALAPAGPLAGVAPSPPGLALGLFVAYGGLMGALLLVASVLGARRVERARFGLGWALAGTAGPLLLLVAASARLAELERSFAFAALALALAALHTLAAEALTRARRIPVAAAFAAGAVVGLALGLAFALEKGWLTVGLALAALGVAWVSTRRPLPGLRPLAAGLGLVVLGRIGWDPTIAGAQLGTTPVLNWLLWGYGVPALAFAAAARLLAPGGDDWSRRVLESLALVFAVLLAALEVRHLAHGGDITALDTRLFELGLLAAVYAAYAVGLSRLAAITGRWLYRLFSDLVAVLAAFCALGALTEGNPLLTGEAVGGLVFNDLLVAYALPAALMLAFAATQPAQRARVRLAAVALGLALALFYVTLEVSRAFQGPVLAPEAISAAEWYAISAAWLGFGIALLGLGLWRDSRALRLASAAVVGATVVKVFVSDMADLEGVLRALSFIGLGVVLVAMGWLYQRLLARKPRS